MKMGGKIAGLIILLYCSEAYTQNPTIDSLRLALSHEKNQERRCDILHEITSQTWDYSFENGLTYAREGLKLAQAEKYIKGQAQGFTDVGLYYFFIGDYKNAIENYQASIRVTQGNIFGRYPAYTFLSIGNVYRVQAQFDSAKVYYDLTEKTLDKQDDIFSRSSLYQNLGMLNNDQSNFLEAIHYFKQSMRVGAAQGHSSFSAECWNGLGHSYKGLTEFDSAIFFYEKAYALAKETKNPEFEMYYFLNRGEIHFLQGEHRQAIELYTQALDILKYHNFERYRIVALKNIGHVFLSKSDYPTALNHYQQAMAVAIKLNSRQDLAQLHGAIGWLHIIEQNDSLAIHYANLSMTEMKVIQDKAGMAFANNLFGYIFHRKKEYSTSIAYYEKSLALREEINSPTLISSTLNNIARVYEDQGLLQKAIEYQLRCIASDLISLNREGLVFSYNSLGSLYTKLGNFTQAETYLLKAKDLAHQVQTPFQKLENLKYLGHLYQAKGNFEKAFRYSQEYIGLNDSLFNIQSSGKLAEMNSLYELQNKEKEIQNLNQENQINQHQIQLQQSRIELQNILLIFTILGIVLLLAIAYILYRYYMSKSKANRQLVSLNHEIQEQKEEIQTQSEELMEANKLLKTLNRTLTEKSEEIQTQSEELTEANQIITSSNKNLELKIEERTSALKEAYKELDIFFYRSSHDFRRPLTTLMGLAEVAKVTLKDQSALDLFGKVNETAMGVDGMLKKLQSVSMIASSELVYDEIDFNRRIDQVCERFHTSIIDKRIRIVRQISLTRTFHSYSAIIEIIFQNLVENAIQYTREDPQITIRVEEQGNQVKIEINDNGDGIPAEFQNRIFEMYFRGTEKSKGNGLGLYIVKKAVEKLKGSYSFSSQVGVGSSFIINLPFEQKSFE